MNKALFLDRDGIINEEINYLHRIEDFVFTDGIFEACRAFAERGFILIVVSNQAGIGRGYYTEDDFARLTEWMNTRFTEQGVRIAKVYYCPFHPTEGIGSYKKDSQDRKPNPGMILKARDEFDLDLEASILVGDRMSDILAGKNAGVGLTVLVGDTPDEPASRMPDRILTNVRDLEKLAAETGGTGRP